MMSKGRVVGKALKSTLSYSYTPRISSELCLKQIPRWKKQKGIKIQLFSMIVILFSDEATSLRRKAFKLYPAVVHMYRMLCFELIIEFIFYYNIISIVIY